MGKPSKPPQPAPPRGLARAIVEAAGRGRIGIVVATGAGEASRARFVSDAAADVLGYSPAELLPLPAESHFAPEQLPEILAWRRGNASGDRQHVIETELVRKDGSHIPVRMAESDALLDGAPAKVSFFFDTMERRLAAEELRDSESRFRALIEAAPDAIAVATRDGLAYMNPALLELLGEPGATELRTTSLVEAIHPDDLPRMLARVQALLGGGDALPAYELRVRRRDGRYIQVEVVDMQTEWGDSPAVLAVARDLSERRQLQADLIQADRLAAVGTLAAGVAHEINNPLAYVLLNLEYLMRELPRFDGDVARLDRLSERLAEARHGAERVGAIVRDLRTFSRADRDSSGPVDVQLVLASALRVAATQLSGHARVVADYADVPPVRADAPRLEQVFLNLLVNAAQALPEDATGEHEVRVAVRSLDPARVAIEITDTGAGIPPELLDRVFDPFFTTKPAGIGTGLGLPICHSIVTAFGGEISVESQVGHGTTFRVALPVDTSGDKVAPEQRSAPSTATPQGARVLVVDDELPVASMLSRVLGDEHEVRVTTSAREALELLVGGEPFDVVLCDLLMPGMSGMDLHQKLAERRPGLEKCLVFMTGGAFTPRASEFLATVPNRRVEKPFDLQEVRQLVRELARSARSVS